MVWEMMSMICLRAETRGSLRLWRKDQLDWKVPVGRPVMKMGLDYRTSERLACGALGRIYGCTTRDQLSSPRICLSSHSRRIGS